MKIKHVERYTIPIDTGLPSAGENTGATKVRDLHAALEKLPNGGIVSLDFSGSNLFVTWYNDDIDT